MEFNQIIYPDDLTATIIDFIKTGIKLKYGVDLQIEKDLSIGEITIIFDKNGIIGNK